MRHASLLALLLCPAATLLGADPPDDRTRLQGVWLSPPDAKLPVRLIAFDDKLGYTVGDPTATPAVPKSSFVALSPAELREEGGKRVAELAITKEVKRRVEYRLEKDGLVVGIDGAEHPLRRANTRPDDPAAKPLAGTWTVTGMEAKGKKATAKEAGFDAVTFGDRYAWKGPDKVALNVFYRLGPVKDGRAELDVFGMKGDVVIAALVEVKENEVAIVQPLKPGGDRPTGFDTAGGDVLVIRAKRAK